MATNTVQVACTSCAVGHLGVGGTLIMLKLNLLKDPEFAEFHGVLATREYIEQATLVMAEMKGSLWEKGLLGDHCPRTLLDTPVYLNGLYFGLRCKEEHMHL